MIEVKIDAKEIETLRNFFNSTSKELNAASNRAIKKTIASVQTQALKEVSAQSGVQQKILKDRAFTSFDNAKKEGRFWFGLYRVSLARLNPKQTRNGVKAGIKGSIFRAGAFLMKISKNNGGSAVVPFQVMKRAGRERFPLIKQTYDYKVAAELIEKDILPKVPLILLTKLRQELNWETLKRS